MSVQRKTIEVRRYRGQTNPQNLFRLGPVVGVTVLLPKSAQQVRKENPQVQAVALIDTGADRTCISDRIVQVLKLMPTATVAISGVHGVGSSNQYCVDFNFTGSDILVTGLQVFDYTGSGPFDMLIGRDVLRGVLFIYDGRTGEIGLELPSNCAPLSKPPWINLPKQISLPPPSPSDDKKE